jgi:hypothetical protein
MPPALRRLDQNLKSLRKLDPPMSNWFGSVSQAMDTVSYAIKAGGFTVLHRSMADDFQFQQDMLTSLIRFLREKCAQQRDVLLRVKHEREELKILRKCAKPVDNVNS